MNLLHIQLLQESLLFVLRSVQKLKQAPAFLSVELDYDLEIVEGVFVPTLLLDLLNLAIAFLCLLCISFGLLTVSLLVCVVVLLSLALCLLYFLVFSLNSLKKKHMKKMRRSKTHSK